MPRRARPGTHHAPDGRPPTLSVAVMPSCDPTTRANHGTRPGAAAFRRYLFSHACHGTHHAPDGKPQPRLGAVIPAFVCPGIRKPQDTDQYGHFPSRSVQPRMPRHTRHARRPEQSLPAPTRPTTGHTHWLTTPAFHHQPVSRTGRAPEWNRWRGPLRTHQISLDGTLFRLSS